MNANRSALTSSLWASSRAFLFAVCQARARNREMSASGTKRKSADFAGGVIHVRSGAIFRQPPRHYSIAGMDLEGANKNKKIPIYGKKTAPPVLAKG